MDWLQHKVQNAELVEGSSQARGVTNFIQTYLYQFFDDSHSLNSTGEP